MKDDFIKAVQQYAVDIGDLTKVYIGADSRRRRKEMGIWQINFTTCAVFHLNAKNGAKVFASVERERDFHGSLKLRLMGEVYRAVELYGFVTEIIEPSRVEIHLDINPNPKFKSSTVVQEALGYVKGVTGKDAFIKPDAWAASTCADLWEFKVPDA